MQHISEYAFDALCRTRSSEEQQVAQLCWLEQILSNSGVCHLRDASQETISAECPFLGSDADCDWQVLLYVKTFYVKSN